MLRGIDISKWNQNVKYSEYDFVVMKSSEGVDYKDPALDRHYDALHGSKDGKPDKKKLYGFYHYARPDTGNSARSEAESFLSYVGHHAGNCLFALDWEGKSLKYSPDWALSFLNIVWEKTGSKPLLYISSSQENTKAYHKIKEAGFPLWIAHWFVDSPKMKDWKKYTLWQYTNSPVDTNYFYGDKDMWNELCGRKKTNVNLDKSINVGDTVKVTSAVDYNGHKNDSWVLASKFKILELKDDRAVISSDGKNITGAWNVKDLKEV